MPAVTQRGSLTQYLVEQQREHGRIAAHLRLLIEVVALACKHITIAVNKGALGDVLVHTHHRSTTWNPSTRRRVVTPARNRNRHLTSE